jgi:hypothetical protein
MKRWIVLLCVLLTVGCAVTTGIKDPVIQAKEVYLEALTQFNSALESVNMLLKQTSEAERPALKAELAQYITPTSKALDTWKLVLDAGDLTKIPESEAAYQKSRAALISFTYAQLSKGVKK